MPFVKDDFIVTVVVGRIPSITVPNEYKSITTIGGASPNVGFYYDGGVGATAGDSFELAWPTITPSGAEPTGADFTPAVPLVGRPLAQNLGGSIQPGTVQGNVYNAGNGQFYWWGSVTFTMPSGQTEDTVYNGEVRINY